MEYSNRTISAALIRTIATSGKGDLEKFLVQQNMIQFVLMLLIRSRSKLSDKDFVNWIENQTLGQLIQLYKICVAKPEEILVINLLKEYNKKRKYLVHDVLKDCDYRRLKGETKIANENGLEIIKSLETLLVEEVSRTKPLSLKMEVK